jgi:hypothetical protein
MDDLEDYNVYLEVNVFCCKAPKPYSILKSILNYQKKEFYWFIGRCETTFCHASYDTL